MAMIRWEPFREMVSLRDPIDRLFEESFIRRSRLCTKLQEGDFSLYIYQTDKEIVVKASLPGVKPEEIDISITGDALTIKVEHKEEKETKKEDFFQKEMSYGTFTRTVAFPVPVQIDKAEATFENGIVALTIPKAEEAKPKQIKIKPKAVG
jgi:HSP20 family protein